MVRPRPLAFLFEVEWTAMVGDAVLRRGREIPVADEQARFLVVPAERAELLRLKMERSPWLRDELERQNWHVLKWQHLDTLVGARPGPAWSGSSRSSVSTRSSSAGASS